MTKKSIKVISLILFILIVGCSNALIKESEKESSNELTRLLMYRKGDKPSNYDALMAIVNERMGKEIGVFLDIQYIGWGDYEKKMSVITASGEYYDIAFASNYRNNAQKGVYMDLTELAPRFAKETYESLNPHYIKGNAMNGQLFSLPVNGNVYGQTRMAFEKELVDKYELDITQVKAIEDLEPLLAVIKKNEPQVIPLNFGPNTRVGQMDYIYNSGIPLGIDTSVDSIKIINPYKESEKMIKDLQTMNRYYQKGYIKKDAAIRDNDIPAIESGWFVRFPTQGPFDYGDLTMTKTVGREIISVPLSKPIIDNMQIFVSNFVISSTSKYPEKALEALNLINTDRDLLTTMIYGVENEGWEKSSVEGKIKILPGYHPTKTIGSAWSVGDNEKVYIDEDVTDEQILERIENINNAEVSPLLGFNFDAAKVTKEIMTINSIMNQYLSPLHSGTINPNKVLPELNQKLEEAGLLKVQEEMQQQFEVFLAKDKEKVMNLDEVKE